MEETILRSEAKKIIDTGGLVDLSFITADRRRGTGGHYIEVKQWAKLQQDAPDQNAVPADLHRPKRELVKNPNHRANKTFNIFNPRNPSVHPHKVHYRLMDRINGKRIIQ